MSEKQDNTKEPVTIIDEIEQQLKIIFRKKKEEVKFAVEEKINLEKLEVQKRMELFEKRIVEEKASRMKYKEVISDMDGKKTNIKKQIRIHLEKAIHFQSNIKSLTKETYDELKIVDALNRKLGSIDKDALGKMSKIEEDIEEKNRKISQLLPSVDEKTEDDIENEIFKLKKIRELLETDEHSDEAERLFDHEDTEIDFETIHEEIQEPEKVSELIDSEFKRIEENSETDFPAPTWDRSLPESQFMEKKNTEENQISEAIFLPEDHDVPGSIDEKRNLDFAPTQDTRSIHGRSLFQEAFEALEKHRKFENIENYGEISYFEKGKKIILDGESLFAQFSSSLEKAKKTYEKLNHIESAQEQFILKQSIIKQQDFLRNLISSCISMCEKKSCSLPRYTLDIFSIDVLKDILENVSMQNWNDMDDFEAFNEHIKDLKNSYYSSITPPSTYLESILKELNSTNERQGDPNATH